MRGEVLKVDISSVSAGSQGRYHGERGSPVTSQDRWAATWSLPIWSKKDAWSTREGLEQNILQQGSMLPAQFKAMSLGSLRSIGLLLLRKYSSRKDGGTFTSSQKGFPAHCFLWSLSQTWNDAALWPSTMMVRFRWGRWLTHDHTNLQRSPDHVWLVLSCIRPPLLKKTASMSKILSLDKWKYLALY